MMGALTVGTGHLTHCLRDAFPVNETEHSVDSPTTQIATVPRDGRLGSVGDLFHRSGSLTESRVVRGGSQC